jgi:cleavage stimulation factor subunit 2
MSHFAAAPIPGGAQPPKTVNRNCTLFVGNIPYEATEEELRNIFSRVGPVVSIRLMYDKDSRQPKGYGFCEYRDIETAYSCMRNLANVEYNGRPMRVDWADHELRNADAVQKVLRTTGEMSERTEKIVSEKIGEFRSKLSDELMDTANNELRGHREIELVIDSLNREQLISIIKEFKELISINLNNAKFLLNSNPSLRFALLYAIQRLGASSDQFTPLAKSELDSARQRLRVNIR